MDAGTILQQVLRQRETWVTIDGKQFCLRRPPEAEFPKFIERIKVEGKAEGELRWRVGLEDVKRCVVDWKGVKESDLLVSGADDPAPFSPDLWAAVIVDKTAWNEQLAQALLDIITRHQLSSAATEKN